MLYKKILLNPMSLMVGALLFANTIKGQEINNESAQKENEQLEDLFITVNRMPEIKNQTASTVTIINQKEIEQLAQINPDITSIIALGIPGASMASNTMSNRSQTLRGRQMLVLIDGIPQSTPLRSTDRDLRTIDPFSLERIEVVKGASAIYGNGAIGGIVNLITKKAPKDKTFSGRTTVGLTSPDTFEDNKTFGYKINQLFSGKADKLEYVVNGTLNQTGRAVDGEGVYISPRYGLGETQTKNVLGKLTYRFNENNSLEGMYNYYSSTQNSDLIAKGGKYLESPQIGVVGKKHPDAIKEGTHYNHNAYLKYLSKDIFANTSMEASVFMQSLYTVFDYRPHKEGTKPRWEETGGQATIKADKIGARLNLSSNINWNDNIYTTVLYGVDFLLDKTSQPLVDGRLWVPELKAYNTAGFVQTKTSLWNNVIFKFGARYDDIKVDVPDYKTIPLKKNQVWDEIKGGKLNYNNIAINGALSYVENKSFQPFVAFSQGFTIFDLGRTLRAAKSDVLSKIATEPVKTDNYELGFNSEIMPNVNLGASYFYTYSKLGSDLEAGDDGFWKVSRAPQRVSGFELSLDAVINKYIEFGGYISYFEGRKKLKGDDHFNGYMSGLSIPASQVGANINLRPFSNFNLKVNYIHSSERDRFEPVLNKKNGTYAYKEGEGIVRPIDLFHAVAQLKLNRFNLNFGVENLFNKTYYTSTSMVYARDAEYARGNGRTYSLSLQYTY